MATIISTKTSGVGGLEVTGDATGILQLASNNGTTAVTVDASQNVGIGTASPSAKLEVSSSATTGRILLNAVDLPMITNGFDKFTSGAYNGAGRWGMFMEPSQLTLGCSTNGNFTFKHFNADSTSTERMRIDTSGNVTAPNQPVACIRTDVTYNAPASDTKMVFTSLTTNVGSYYSTSTGRFTAPVAGTYFFYTSMHTNGTGAGRHTIRRNGTQFFGAAVTSTSWSNACCSGFITMAANDYLEIWCNAGAYIHGDPNWGSWGIRLVS